MTAVPAIQIAVVRPSQDCTVIRWGSHISPALCNCFCYNYPHPPICPPNLCWVEMEYPAFWVPWIPSASAIIPTVHADLHCLPLSAGPGSRYIVPESTQWVWQGGEASSAQQHSPGSVRKETDSIAGGEALSSAIITRSDSPQTVASAAKWDSKS